MVGRGVGGDEGRGSSILLYDLEECEEGTFL